MAKARMCPHCRAFIDSAERTCPYCENDLPATAGARIRAAERMSAARPSMGFTTMVIMLVCGCLFVISWVLTTRMSGEVSLMGGIDGRALVLLGAKFGPAIGIYGEWWRLITANFLHGGLMHIGFNMMSLYTLGPLAENMFGTSRYVVLYVAAGVCGFLASTLYSSSVSIGASASICGLIGAMYTYGRKHLQSHIQAMARGWIIAIAIFGFFFPNIDNAAHLGGLLAGAAFGMVCPIPGQQPQTEAMWKMASIATGCLTAGALLLAYLSFTQSTA